MNIYKLTLDEGNEVYIAGKGLLDAISSYQYNKRFYPQISKSYDEMNEQDKLDIKVARDKAATLINRARSIELVLENVVE